MYRDEWAWPATAGRDAERLASSGCLGRQHSCFYRVWVLSRWESRKISIWDSRRGIAAEKDANQEVATSWRRSECGAPAKRRAENDW